MDGFTLAALLVAGVVVMTPLAERTGVPQPVLLTVFGACLALLPSTHVLDLDPELILPLVLPPLLFAATQRTTVQEFRQQARAVLLLAVGLTLATVAVVAFVAHACGLPWAPAWVLGAVVSPPDPVAATAVARKLRLPHRLVTILEGEGMFNDATALVAYKVAVAAAVTGQLTLRHSLLELASALAFGTGVGLFLGWVTQQVLAAIEEPYAETTVTVLVPFVAYVGAERLGGSGVLAVLTLGLFLRSFAHAGTTSRGWLLGRAVWSYVDFLVTSLVFALLGLELVEVLDSTEGASSTATLAGAVVGTLVVFRAAWIFPAAWLAGRRARRTDTASPVGWRESAVVSWSGMRGVVTVATALALPMSVDGGTDFPHRDSIVVVALVSVLVTLVVQGLTLAPLVAWLGVAQHAGDDGGLADLRGRSARAALEHLRSRPAGAVPEQIRRAAIVQYEGFVVAQQAMSTVRRSDERGSTGGDELAVLLREASGVERDIVLEARRRGTVTAAAADEVLRDIEGRALRDFD